MSAPRTQPLSRHRRLAVWVLVVLGAIVLALSVLSGWIRLVALDDDVWTNSSGQLLESAAVRSAVATYTVDALYSSDRATARLEQRLPNNLKPLAPQIAGALQQVVYRVTEQALSRPRVQALWREANRRAHTQLVAALEGHSDQLKITNNEVQLDLAPVIGNIAASLGLGANVTKSLEGRIQPIVLVKAKQLSSVQRLVRVLRAASLALFLVALALWAGAVYLAGGMRRVTVRRAAVSLVITGVVFLLVLSVGGGYVVNSLVKTQSVRPAARDVWSIYTSVLHDASISLIVIGVVGIAWAWLSGPAARAVWVRRRVGPFARDHAWLLHGALALVLVILVVWGPVGHNTRVITTLILIALAFTALETWRRQTVRELAASDDADSAAAEEARLAELGRLAELYDRGALTDEEYAAAKANWRTA
ncbi:MAG TPA: SHOCT domain-containing protein [Gaiellaceae bacterium]|jgi:fumarate reductase subunit D